MVLINYQKDIIRKPDFVSAPEVEAIAKGMWNVANNKEFDPKGIEKTYTNGN